MMPTTRRRRRQQEQQQQQQQRLPDQNQESGQQRSAASSRNLRGNNSNRSDHQNNENNNINNNNNNSTSNKNSQNQATIENRRPKTRSVTNARNNGDCSHLTAADESNDVVVVDDNNLQQKGHSNREDDLMEACDEVSKESEINRLQMEKLNDECVQKNVLDLLENDLSCAICREIYINPVILNCTHSFCKFCLNAWFIKQDQCPSCRIHTMFHTDNLALREVVDKMVIKMSKEFRDKREETIKSRIAQEKIQERELPSLRPRNESATRRIQRWTGSNGATLWRTPLYTRNRRSSEFRCDSDSEDEALATFLAHNNPQRNAGGFWFDADDDEDDEDDDESYVPSDEDNRYLDIYDIDAGIRERENRTLDGDDAGSNSYLDDIDIDAGRFENRTHDGDGAESNSYLDDIDIDIDIENEDSERYDEDLDLEPDMTESDFEDERQSAVNVQDSDNSGPPRLDPHLDLLHDSTDDSDEDSDSDSDSTSDSDSNSSSDSDSDDEDDDDVIMSPPRIASPSLSSSSSSSSYSYDPPYAFRGILFPDDDSEGSW